MKKIIITALLLFNSCESHMKNPIIISNKNNSAEVKIELTRYDKSKNLYHGKATVKNLSKDKILKISGFDIKDKSQIYSLYIDSIATILFVEVYPQKIEKIKIVTSQIPVGVNFDELKIKLDFPKEDLHSLGNFKISPL